MICHISKVSWIVFLHALTLMACAHKIPICTVSDLDTWHNILRAADWAETAWEYVYPFLRLVKDALL
jgi:hypothetical protein